MVHACAAYNCTNRHGGKGKDGRKITFHRFPLKNAVLCRRWVLATKRENFHPTHYHVLCSEHFEEDSYCSNYVNRRQLKCDAVPTIFDFPPHLIKARKNRRVLERCGMDENFVTEDTDTASAPETISAAAALTATTLAAVGGTISTTTTNNNCGNSWALDKEHNYVLSPCPSMVRKKYEEILSRKQQQIDKCRQALKCAKEKVKRQARKIQKLETLFTELKSKKIISNDLQIR